MDSCSIFVSGRTVVAYLLEKAMNLSLVVIAGPAKGQIFPVLASEMVIGRGSGNPVCIEDYSVSRKHCRIQTGEDYLKLVDLDSRNGTFVNDTPIKERILRSGDRIRIGDTVLLLMDHEPVAQSAGPIPEIEMIGRTTLRLSEDEAKLLIPDELPQTEKLSRDLNALLQISKRIHSIRTLEDLQNELLDCIQKNVPAEHAAVVLFEELSGEIDCIRTRNDQEMILSRTVIREAVSTRASILMNDVIVSSGAKSESLQTSGVSSLMVIPILLREKVQGTLYFYTADPSIRFDESQLQLFTGIAGIASVALENVRHLEWLKQENRRLVDATLQHSMIGECKVMQDVYRFISKVALGDSTVLIQGESGTGKELAAQAIHRNSSRKEGPFVAINCAALPESLLESELFGYEKGAFTGALARKKGKLEIANGGTVFLDEIGEMSLPLQAKLLRVLQEREVERLGGTVPIHLDVRFLAATNQDLAQRVQAGGFRQDLYYRLNVISVTMPPLRQRRDDIPLLASYFTARHSARVNRPVQGVSREAIAYLIAYDWPGNVRELENTIERAVVLGSTEFVLPEDLPEMLQELDPASSVPVARIQQAVNEAKKEAILKALKQARFNYPEAAALLGIHVNHMHRLIRNLHLKDIISGMNRKDS